ncbi:MAG TPA: polysaccharide deacetylase family protein [Bauldia sp.]|nr:polysaccharide deacetylase family protein [Bauldia sp.]
MPLLRSAFAGRGAILAFHEINTDPSAELLTGCSTAFLDAALVWLRRNRWEFVTLDEGLRRANDPGRRDRFVVITFDDGYRDTHTLALPILERHGAPFTVYVPTAAVTRTLDAWWLGLRELIRRRDTISIEGMGKTLECRDLASKAKALARGVAWFHQDLRRTSHLQPLFRQAGISLQALDARYFLDETELRRLASHPLASIQAHTSNHPALTHLDEISVWQEMSENRAWLENLLQSPVDHFAYPYGHRRAAGQREAAIAAAVGFKSAVTTRSGPVTDSDAATPHLLPRIWVGTDTSIARLDAGVSGVEKIMKRAAVGIGLDANA